MKKIAKILTVVVLLVILSLSVVGCTFVDNGQSGGNTTYLPEVDTQNIVLPEVSEQQLTSRQTLSKTEVVKMAKKSVVAIELQTTAGSAYGAGVAVDISTGNGDVNEVYVITCHHVIEEEGATVIVVFPDENLLYENADYTFSGVIGGNKENYSQAVMLVGGDKEADIAVLRVNLDKKAESGEKLEKSKIGTAILPPSSYQIQEGEDVIAIGNPTGALPGWVADGLISLVETTTTVGDIGKMKLIGINATINHGNSGGGLFNMYGELIGITNAGSDDYQAINFAIPLYTSDANKEGVIDSGMVNIVKQLLATETETNYGYVAGRKAKFGFTTVNSDGNTVIYSVTENSTAYNAGLRQYDVVSSYKVNNGTAVTSFTYDQLADAFSALAIGDTIELTVTRTVEGSRPWETSQTTASVSLTATQFHFCNTGR